jgi:hypothetical protein
MPCVLLSKTVRPPRGCASSPIRNVDSVTARHAGELFEAMLLAPILRPMLAGAGTLGDYELDLLARDVARRDRIFPALVAAQLEGGR